uniref:Uncharacterized protein n=1 Tax=Daucus carota subsp. sativus TaxID=79200 RepID=A0A166D3Y8_DAUCS
MLGARVFGVISNSGMSLNFDKRVEYKFEFYKIHFDRPRPVRHLADYIGYSTSAI